MALRVNGERLWARVEALGRIGADPAGGVTRIGYSAQEGEARAYVAARLKEIGFDARMDSAGNLIGRKPGSAALPAIAAGSHVDTVPRGGRFDGALGVLAALEVYATLADAGYANRHPLELLVFADEEGARFGRGLTGSRFHAGAADVAAWGELRDVEGRPIREVFAAAGADFDRAARDARRGEPPAAYLELHIEQARVLEDLALPVGIVQGIVGILRFQLVFTGMADHAGATPMDLRRDALTCAARLILDAERIARAEGRPVVATVGRLDVAPNVANIIPERVTCTLEVRGLELGQLDAVAERILASGRDHAADAGVGLAVTPTVRTLPVPMDAGLRQIIRAACEQAGMPFAELTSGGGHDAMIMAGIAPTAMIFVRCKDGISHNPLEYVTPEDCEAGAQILLNAVLELDRAAEEPQ